MRSRQPFFLLAFSFGCPKEKVRKSQGRELACRPVRTRRKRTYGVCRNSTGLQGRAVARPYCLPLGMHFSFVRTKEKMPKEKTPAEPQRLLPPCSG